VATLNGTVDDLETELMKKNEEVLILVKKEKVAKQSIRHLQKDLLSATAKLKTARGEISKLKVGEDFTAVPVEKAENFEGSSGGKKSELKEQKRTNEDYSVDTEDDESPPKKVPKMMLSPRSDDESEINTDFTGIEKLDESAAESSDEDIIKKKVEEKVEEEIASEKEETENHDTPANNEKEDTMVEQISKEADSSSIDSTSKDEDDEEFLIRKPELKKSVLTKEGEDSLGDLAEDDSFFHPPSSSKKIGKHLVKNSKTKRTGLSNAPIKKTSKKPRTKTAPEDTNNTTNDSNDEK